MRNTPTLPDENVMVLRVAVRRRKYDRGSDLLHFQLPHATM